MACRWAGLTRNAAAKGVDLGVSGALGLEAGAGRSYVYSITAVFVEATGESGASCGSKGEARTE